MARRHFRKTFALAMAAALAGADAQEPPGPTTVTIPHLEIAPTAEIKPEDFVYVASTRPDRIGRVMAPVFVFITPNEPWVGTPSTA